MKVLGACYQEKIYSGIKSVLLAVCWQMSCYIFNKVYAFSHRRGECCICGFHKYTLTVCWWKLTSSAGEHLIDIIIIIHKHLYSVKYQPSVSNAFSISSINTTGIVDNSNPHRSAIQCNIIIKHELLST